MRPSIIFLVLAPFTLAAQGGRGGRGGRGNPPAPADTMIVSRPQPNMRRGNEADSLAVTHHEITVHGTPIRYTATTGMMPQRNETNGEIEGNIFYVAYTKDGVTDPATRPIMFLFNGGPGSATLWLHLGAFGPKRVKLNADGSNAPPPYSYEENPNTLLDQADLVFLDPVGTGYSRANGAQNGPRFWGLDEDMRSVAEFIRLYLSRSERWASPRFIGGESYGTTRAAHLSGYLTDNGIALNGVFLLSSVLNFENSRPDRGNDIGYIGFFPSFAMTAWYHKKLPPDLQSLSIEDFARKVEAFTTNEYATALVKGAAMTPAERTAIVAQIARYTGTSTRFVEDEDLRIDLAPFSVELMHDTHAMSGRLDSRFMAFNGDPTAGRTGFDPSDASIRNSFTPVVNDYVRRELNFHDDDIYYVLGGGIGRWRYDEGKYPNVVPSLERAFAKNPDMKLYVAMGYYDMATPYWAVQYTLDHMTVDPKVRANNIRTDHFQAGHMMYIDGPSMTKLRADLRKFIEDACRSGELELRVKRRWSLVVGFLHKTHDKRPTTNDRLTPQRGRYGRS
jgi:carboxypeptidase C (cathepsin A)